MLNGFNRVSGAAQNAASQWVATRAAVIRDTPPYIRKVEIGYAELYRRSDNAYVGAFLPEIYELAKIGRLEVQIAAQAWKQAQGYDSTTDYTVVSAAMRQQKPLLYAALYHVATDSLKSPFELAVYPSKSKDDIGAYVTHEYTHLRAKGLPLPRMVPKYDILRSYLTDIGKVGLHANVPGRKNPAQIGITINIENPEHNSTTRERTLHYIGQWAAWTMTFSAAISTAFVELALGAAAPWMVIPVVIAAWVANTCGNYFSQFDTAEALFRDIGWMRDPALRRGGRIDRRKALLTVAQVLAIGLFVAWATTASWGMIVNLPWESMARIPYLPISFAKYFTATFVAMATALGAWSGKAFANQYFWPFGIYDTQVDFTARGENAGVAERLAVVPIDDTHSALLERQRDQALRLLLEESIKYPMPQVVVAEHRSAICLHYQHRVARAKEAELSAQAQLAQQVMQDLRELSRQNGSSSNMLNASSSSAASSSSMSSSSSVAVSSIVSGPTRLHVVDAPDVTADANTVSNRVRLALPAGS